MTQPAKGAKNRKQPAEAAPSDRVAEAVTALAAMLLLNPYDVETHVKPPEALMDALAYEATGIARTVFSAAAGLKERNGIIEAHRLHQAVHDAGHTTAEVDALMDIAPLAFTAPDHVAEIIDHQTRKRIIEAARDHSGSLQNVLAEIKSITEPILTRAQGIISAPLSAVMPPIPEHENPAAILKNGYLRKGGALMLVSTSGVGKSVFSIQACLHWAMGVPCFGITPVKPLKIAIFQTEDDDEELHYFKEQITGGMVESMIATPEQAAQAADNVLLVNSVGAIGAEFLSRLDALLRATPDIDLVVANPLQGVFGGDLSKNAELSAFLRGGIDPIIKPARAGLFLIHHTNKPPASKDRNGWGSDAFSAYVGAGGAELTNWVRAALALMPVEGAQGLFRLTAAKRGQRLNWRDDAELPVNYRFIGHSEGRVYWRNTDYAEGNSVHVSGVDTPRLFPDCDFVTLFEGGSLIYSDAILAAKNRLGLGVNRAKDLLRQGVERDILQAKTEGRKVYYELSQNR